MHTSWIQMELNSIEFLRAQVTESMNWMIENICNSLVNEFVEYGIVWRSMETPAWFNGFHNIPWIMLAPLFQFLIRCLERFTKIQLSMFTDPSQPNKHFPKLKGKAAEVKALVEEDKHIPFTFRSYIHTHTLTHMILQMQYLKNMWTHICSVHTHAFLQKHV